MERRTYSERVASNVVAAIAASGVPTAVIAQGTDIPLDVLESFLNSEVPFGLNDLGHVGAFLHVSPISFLKGAAA